MNKLLTKEQAEWLIKRLERIPPQLRTDGVTWIEGDRVRRAVQECTEKEFPQFEIDLFQAASTNMFVDIPYNATVSIYPHVITNEPVLMIKNEQNVCTSRFNLTQFKEFIECINKIMEYYGNEQ